MIKSGSILICKRSHSNGDKNGYFKFGERYVCYGTMDNLIGMTNINITGNNGGMPNDLDAAFTKASYKTQYPYIWDHFETKLERVKRVCKEKLEDEKQFKPKKIKKIQ